MNEEQTNNKYTQLLNYLQSQGQIIPAEFGGGITNVPATARRAQPIITKPIFNEGNFFTTEFDQRAVNQFANRGLSGNFLTKTRLSDDEIKARATKRAVSSNQRFQSGMWDYSDNNWYSMKGNIAGAMGQLSEMFAAMGLTVMFDNKGYFAYKVVDKDNNSMFSTNLNRVKRYIRTGKDDPTATSRLNINNARKNILYSPAWGVVINWHKLLNASRTFGKKGGENLDSLMQKSEINQLKNLYVKAAYFKQFPDEFNNYATRNQNAAANYTNRQNARLERMKRAVSGIGFS